MATSINFSNYGFFDEHEPLTQVNWASYFSPVVPDGVIAGIGDELLVDANSTGMKVRVHSGECRVRSHRGELSLLSEVDIPAASNNPRIDLVVARVTYDNASMIITSIKGTPAANPVCPQVTQNAGNVWEIPLAEVLVPKNAMTISAENVTDRRYIYQMSGTSAISFSGETLAVANDWEYRSQETEIDSLTISLPTADPAGIWMCSVNFTSSDEFEGVSFVRGGESYEIKTTDSLVYKGSRYNLIIWWDGAYFWVGAKAS